MKAGDVKAAARGFGADLIGIGSMDRFAEASPDRSPSAIFPECRSVIVVGRRILRGSLRGVEEGTNFVSTYKRFGFTLLEDNFLAQTTYDLTCWIEEQGFEAVPLFGYAEEGMPKGRPVHPDKPAPNVYVDIHHAAMAAGLGEIGLMDTVLTPEFGPRQRFALILTDAELDADPVRDRRICVDCSACVDACPLGAIHADALHEAGLPGHSMDVATVDYDVCARCPNGAMSAPGRGSRPDRLAASCARACLVQLEKAGKCGNRFEFPFRKRNPWAMDALERNVPGPQSRVADTDGHAVQR